MEACGDVGVEIRIPVQELTQLAQIEVQIGEVTGDKDCPQYEDNIGRPLGLLA